MNDALFKGYTPTNNKKCMLKFKGKEADELLTYEQVQNLPEYAGILAEGVILIDVDDSAQADIMFDIVESENLATRVYKTSRGMHFLFKNTDVQTCKTCARLACGLDADIKLGARNSYEVLKYAGKEREIIYDKFDDEEYSELPKFFKPIKSSVDFLNMSAGDGRNQAFFNYILTLQGNGFTTDETRKTITLINAHVLKDKLSDNELNTVLRDEAFRAPNFYDGKSFQFDKFALFLKNEYNVIKINNRLHVFQDGVYIVDNNYIESKMIDHIPQLKKQQRAEVMAYIDLLISENSTPSDANFIAFENGILDINTGLISPFDPSIIITNKIKHNYNPTAYNELGDKVLNKLSCGDEEIRRLLEESIGYCFYRRSELRKCFILLGSKRGGKSTYLDIINRILGEENTSALDLADLGDRFKTAELFGKLANLGDDIGDDFIANPAIFKKLVSGDRVTAEKKGQNPFDFNNYAKLIFSANGIPRIKDKSGAVQDRLVIIPFNATFSSTDADYDPHIKYKLRAEEVTEYFIKIAVDGLKRVLNNLVFSHSAAVDKELAEYEEENNPIKSFFNEIGADGLKNQPTEWGFQRYCEFCIANGLSPLGKIGFCKQLKKEMGLEIIVTKVDGKPTRIFK